MSAPVSSDKAELRYACVKDLKALVLALDPYFVGRLERPHHVLMDALTNFRRGLPVTLLDGTVVDPKSYDGLLNFFSRDTWKSTIVCEFFPIWLCLYWLMDPSKPKRPPAILIFQAKLGKAILHLKKIKRLMCSDAFYALFPDFVPPHRDPEKWDTQEYLNLYGVDRGGAKENCIEIASVTASFTGWHVTDKITDDPVTEDNYTSVAEQDKVKDGIRINDNILDSEHGKSYFVGTPYSLIDANVALDNGELGRMLKIICPAFNEPPSRFFEWAKMEEDTPEWHDAKAVVEQTYTLNFPRRLPFDVLAGKLRKQGSKFFTSQQLLDVHDEGTAVFSRSWLANAYLTLAQAKERIKTQPVMLVDSAWKKQHNKGSGDDTAIGVVAYDKDGDIYLLDLHVSDTLTEAAGMQLMASLVKKWGIRSIIKETFGEDGFAVRWRDFCKAENYRYVPVRLPKRSQAITGKENRIRQLAPYFEMGRVFLVDSIPHLDKFEKQYTLYAGEGSGKDDILDMLADAINVEVKPVLHIDAPDTAWQSPYRPVGTQSERPFGGLIPQGGAGWASLKGRVH